MNSVNEQPQFPAYEPPKPAPILDHKTAGPLTKMVSKMLIPKLKMPRGKGVQSDQNVHVKHGKAKKHPNPVTYY
jgi:hypothetical protein